MMKKLVVLLVVAVFVVGLAGLALAGYHRVYKFNYLTGLWQITEDAEMYSDNSDSAQYRWESNENAEVCTEPYWNPTPEDPPQFHIVDRVHLFPWIEVEITEKDLTWDIFKPGDYMAKAFILQLQANCDVMVHLGGGTWEIPTGFVGGDENGHIVFGDITKDEPDDLHECKWREYSLLCKGSPGTPDDMIDVRWWWYVATGLKPPAHEITTEEFALMPPKDQWLGCTDLNSQKIFVYDSDNLHEPEQTHLVFFEDLLVEECDSEGKYVDVFAVTITPDP